MSSSDNHPFLGKHTRHFYLKTKHNNALLSSEQQTGIFAMSAVQIFELCKSINFAEVDRSQSKLPCTLEIQLIDTLYKSEKIVGDGNHYANHKLLASIIYRRLEMMHINHNNLTKHHSLLHSSRFFSVMSSTLISLSSFMTAS